MTSGTRTRSTSPGHVDVFRVEADVHDPRAQTRDVRTTTTWRTPTDEHPTEEMVIRGPDGRPVRGVVLDGNESNPYFETAHDRFADTTGRTRTRQQLIGAREELVPGDEHVTIRQREGNRLTEALYDATSTHALSARTTSHIRLGSEPENAHRVRSIASTNHDAQGHATTTVRAVFDRDGSLVRQVVIDHRDGGRVYTVDRAGVYRDGRGRVLGATRTARLERGNVPDADPPMRANPVGVRVNGDTGPAAFENCVRCAIATDHTLGGHPETATGGAASSALIEETYGRPFRAATLGSIVAEVLRAGHGARGIVAGVSGATGHVFNVVNDGGRVRFFDGQGTGSGASRPDGFTSLLFLRTDDVAPRP